MHSKAFNKHFKVVLKVLIELQPLIRGDGHGDCIPKKCCSAEMEMHLLFDNERT